MEKELGGGVSEALAEFKAAIGAAGPAPTLGKVDGWRVALAALSLPLLQSVCVEIGVEAGAIVGQTASVCVEEALAVEVVRRPPPPKSAAEQQQERLLKALERAEAREAAADAREAAATAAAAAAEERAVARAAALESRFAEKLEEVALRAERAEERARKAERAASSSSPKDDQSLTDFLREDLDD
eukprot:COSAG05_NODE_7706_length_777_cov_2.243363_1_plen_186_part_00